jgi:5-oxoprolinase (ATP-hydrolysing)
MPESLNDSAPAREEWEFFVDTGGTFTDCLGRDPNGVLHRAKVLSRGTLSSSVLRTDSSTDLILDGPPDWPADFPSGFRVLLPSSPEFTVRVTGWEPSTGRLLLDRSIPDGIDPIGSLELLSGEEAPVLGMRLILARNGIELETVACRMRLATTRCTNALLEHAGCPPVLFVTAGFPDLLEIGDQRRTGLFDLVPRKRASLEGPVVEVAERTDRDGKIIHSPDHESIVSAARDALANGHRSATVSFLNSCLNDENERAVVSLLREAGFEFVVGSGATHPFPKWLPRCESAVTEAYLSPILRQYLDSVGKGMGDGGELLVMSSAGGLIDRGGYRAIDSLLSGPAGGVVGAGATARAAGIKEFINLDMGGTSSDVSRYSGSFAYHSAHQVGDARISSIAMKIETVAAGGGSICRVEDGLLRVGPQSAGAHPGPACYGFGGPLCLTDVNLLLGRLDPSRFSTPVSLEDAQDRLAEMVEKSGRPSEELLEGFLAVANDAMANAIRKVSTAEGYDPSEHALQAFGGAGGQHACGVARRLGMKRIFSPADSGLLSAYGLSRARVERLIERSVLSPIDPQALTKLEEEMTTEGLDAIEKLGQEGSVAGKSAFVRLLGQDVPLEIEYADTVEIESLYRKKFERVFGYFPEGRELEVHSMRILVAGASPSPEEEIFPEGPLRVPSESALARDAIEPGQRIAGPCLLADDFGTLWIENGWSACKGTRGSLLLELDESADSSLSIPAAARRELFSSRFLCLVEEMGAQLERTALSVNVRERLDFSCALLDRAGYLVANAPHIPVHLGAMGVCARHLLELFPSLRPGDVLVSNHPAFGGSHLPDVTVLAPVFGTGDQPFCFLANRAHHAEIGGVSPGSMPAGTSSLSEEGIVISPRLLFKAGESRMDQLGELLRSSSHPSRQPEQNLADLSAQVASLRKGIEGLDELVKAHGEDTLAEQMDALREESSASCSRFIKEMGECEFSAIQALDDGDRLALRVTVEKGRATFDFSGTSLARDDNLNATEAIVTSAACYCLRVLIAKDLPLNEGLLEPVDLIIPEGSLLHPSFPDDPAKCPGVAGGNVEVSQRIVDLILSAFGRVACSQGTMNNLTFGNASFSHYETIGGGAGAALGQEGTSAVQVHMTNTAITDPEILESRFPVRLIGFCKRTGSGGKGSWNGGDGIERHYLFEEEIELSLLTQRRTSGPDGLCGGEAGLPGEQILIRTDGTEEILKSADSRTAYPGDRLILRTPGGGGAGEPELLA